MTASEFLKSRMFPNLDNFNTMSVTKLELLNLLQEFALLKCAEQRKICADNAKQERDVNGGFYALYIDKDSILDSPTQKCNDTS